MLLHFSTLLYSLHVIFTTQCNFEIGMPS